MFGFAGTIVYEGCFKDLLCISISLLLNPLLMSTMGAFIKKRAPLYCFYKARLMRELYFECTYETVSAGEF